MRLPPQGYGVAHPRNLPRHHATLCRLCALCAAEDLAQELVPALSQYPTLRQGSFSAAMEELAEAAVFTSFLAEGRLLRSGELPLVEPEEYLGGVLDFTGEHLRGVCCTRICTGPLGPYATLALCTLIITASCWACLPPAGELNRYAVMRASARDKATVQRCRDLVEALQGQFLKLDLRNGALRKKYDALK